MPIPHAPRQGAVPAETLRREGVDLTPSRRRILDILAEEGRPLGAYEMIERVAQVTGKRPAPITIYRALDFLLENGLVHRLASCNAYLACRHGHAAEAAIVFLICENCGEVVEATSDSLQEGLASLATQASFAPRAQVMEIAGLCRICPAAPEPREVFGKSNQDGSNPDGLA